MRHILSAILLLTTIPVAAVEIPTLAGAAVTAPLLEMAKAFQQRTGHEVKVQFDTVPNIMRRLTPDAADVLIATSAGVEQAIKEGKADGATRVPLGRVGIGVGVSRGAAKPDISTVDALKAAILKANAVVTSQGTSGAYVLKMLNDLGVAEQIKAKTVQVPSGVAVMERLGKNSNEIGFTMLSEVMYGDAHGGGTLVGPLPSAIQNYTSYEAVVLGGAKAPEQARQFVRTLASRESRKLFASNGWQVPDIFTQGGVR
jgi:molybdate transport system substrate-binding protein